MKHALRRFVKAPLKVFTPHDNFAVIWNFIIMAFILVDTFLTPFEISFYNNDRENDLLLYSLPALETIFFIDILINFRTAYYDKGVLVTASKPIFMEYLRKGFAIDAIAVFADFISTFAVNSLIWYIRAIKIIRIKKLKHIMERVEDFLNLSRSASASLKLIRLAGTILIVAHWIACIFHMIGYSNNDFRDSWLIEYRLYDKSIYERYIAAFYWAVTTMITVGYGDIHPTNAIERIFTIGAMVVACALFGYSMSTVGSIIHEITFEKQQAREKIRSIKNYMNEKNLGRNIQTRVKNYIQYMIDSKNFHKHDEDEFFKMLSQNLKDEIISEVNGKILTECRIFSTNFSNKALMYLARFMQEKFVSPEEMIFSEGDEEDYSIYFIAYGKIQIFYKSKAIKELTNGEYFGELAFFTKTPRTASAKSLFFSSLFYLKAEDAVEHLQAFPSDFEMYHMIKDGINLHNRYEQINVACYSCSQIGHLALNCPKTHYVPDKEAVIKEFRRAEQRFRSSFKRRNRPRFHVLLSLSQLNQAALYIQDDYDDTIISDDDVSQDSLDLILERNLFVIPAAELNDMKTRKAERNKKGGPRFDVQMFFDDINEVNNLLENKNTVLPYSPAGHPDMGEQSPWKNTNNNNDHLFFTIDKVEKFEVYFPHNNINKLIGDFEKHRLARIQTSQHGIMKTLLLKNLSGFQKQSVLAQPPIKNRRSSKFLTEVPLLNRLKTEMKRAALDKKQSEKQVAIKEKQDTKHENHRLSIPTNKYNLKVEPASKNSVSKSEDDVDSSSDEDLATISKFEARNMERRKTNLRQYMNNINSLYSIKNPSQVMSQNNLNLPESPKRTNASMSSKFPFNSASDFSAQIMLPTPVDSREISSFNKLDLLSAKFTRGGSSMKIPTINSPSHRASQEMSYQVPALFKTERIGKLGNISNFEDALLRSLLASEQDTNPSSTRYRRSKSYDKILQMKRVIKRYKMAELVKNIIGQRMKKMPTAAFGHS